jgi:hypothetical protein
MLAMSTVNGKREGWDSRHTSEKKERARAHIARYEVSESIDGRVAGRILVQFLGG